MSAIIGGLLGGTIATRLGFAATTAIGTPAFPLPLPFLFILTCGSYGRSIQVPLVHLLKLYNILLTLFLVMMLHLKVHGLSKNSLYPVYLIL